MGINRHPIIVQVMRITPHTRTIKYEPDGDPQFWETGSIYIPKALTCNAADKLCIRVEWDMNAASRFVPQSR